MLTNHKDMKTRYTILGSVCLSLTLLSSFFLGFVSCRDEKIIEDQRGDDITDGVEEELLDSIVEYNNSRCLSREIWIYDEFGRQVECNSYSFDTREHYYNCKWSYSDGGKEITTIQSEKEGNEWEYKWKGLISIVADRDTCTDRYKRVDNTWVLYGKYEHICDKEGRSILESGYFPDKNYGNKIEKQYDDKGRCILNKSYTWKDDNWILARQTECSFDEKGNCVYRKTQDSLMERSFDDQNREISYSLMKWDYSKSCWVGKQKYYLVFDDMGNVIENTNYIWNSVIQKWIPDNKSCKTFDNEGHTTVTADYTWKNDKWCGQGYKLEKRYDAYGNLTYDARYIWNEQNSCWVLNDSKSEQFDSEGNLIQSISESGDGSYYEEMKWEKDKYIRVEEYVGDDGEMYAGFRTIEYKDESGRRIMVVESSWSNGRWEDNTRITTSYDNKGREECLLRYSYYDGTWSLINGYKYEVIRVGNRETRQKREWKSIDKEWSEPFNKVVTVYDDYERVIEVIDWSKTEYTYDSNGNQTLIVISYWDTESNQWTPEEKTEYAFDSANNKILEARYRLNHSTNCWVGSEKNEVEYDAEGKKTIELIYRWDITSEDWYASKRTEFKYDSDGNLIDNASYGWGYFLSQWMWRGMYRTIYVIDPETKVHCEYNLQYNIYEEKWEGNRIDIKNDEKGNVTQEIYYSWNNDQWVITREIDRTFDLYGKMLSFYSYSIDNQGDISEVLIDNIYDSKNRLVSTVQRHNGNIIYRKNFYYSIHKVIRVTDGLEF